MAEKDSLYNNPFESEDKNNKKKFNEPVRFDSWINKMNIFYNFFKRPFNHHFIFLIFIMVAIILLFQLFLYFYTNHNSYISVPNFYGYNITQVDKIAQNSNVRFTIMDSVYKQNVPLGAIVSQEPIEGEMVKENRTIYLVKNVSYLKKIPMPKIVGRNIRVATKILSETGLKIGNIIYSEDVAKNVIMSCSINGIPIAPTTPIALGTKVDIVVSKGIHSLNDIIPVPNLLGLTINQFEYKLRNYQIKYQIVNQGDLEDFDNKKPSLIVVKQYPLNEKVDGGQLSMSKNSTLKLWVEEK